ncbi:MAG: hypothetical protein ACP5KH_02610, partial [Thermodesulfovibrio sp.]
GINQSLLDLIRKHKLWIKSVISRKQTPHREIVKFAKSNGIDYYLIYMDAVTEKDLELSMPFYEFMKLIKELRNQYSGIKPVYCKGFTGGDKKYHSIIHYNNFSKSDPRCNTKNHEECEL